jgi:hypothetical protein
MVTLPYDLPFDPTAESVPEQGSQGSGGSKDQPVNMSLLESVILSDRQVSQRQTLMDSVRDRRRRLSNPDGFDIATHADDNWVWTQDVTGAIWTYRLK